MEGPGRSKEEVIALVPWIDFMNHDPDSKAYVAGMRDAVGPWVLLKTDRPYKGHLARKIPSFKFRFTSLRMVQCVGYLLQDGS